MPSTRMDLISLLITFAVLGLIVWLVTTYIPMSPPIRTVLVVLVVIALCVFLLKAFGLGDIQIGR